MGKWLIRLIMLGIVVGGIWGASRLFRDDEQYELRTATVAQGELSMTVTATGHLAPTTEVIVGCEVSGTVHEVLAEDNDRVQQGQVLARLKPELFKAEHDQAVAELARAKANVTLLEVEAAEAKRQYDRVAGLRRSGAAAKHELESLLAIHDAAVAKVTAGNAALANAQSQVDLTKYRLGKTIIVSPIDGVVLDRRVDAGQTVAAALQSPDLFVMAEDLVRMDLRADVSEADVGYIAPGQTATFTVNAFRDRTFTGRVRQILNQPKSVSNVVTYTVEIDVDNRDRLLRPGMPADVEIEVVRLEQADKIVNAALRFRPPIEPDQVRGLLDGLTWPTKPAPIDVIVDTEAVTEGNVRPPSLEPTKGMLWQHLGDEWRPVPVWTGYTDDRETVVFVNEGVDRKAGFVTQIRKIDGDDGGQAFQKAIKLADPKNRRL